MAEIFVSYRRDDTGILCERVASRLSARFGERRVFRDATSIYVGSSWEQILHTALQDCYVVIALIGADWLNARDAQGHHRLFDVHDFVRMELATALAQGKRIIPVLANGARMPLASELPPDLAPLARLPPLQLRPDPYFDGDMQAIIQLTAPGVKKRVPHPAIALCGIAGLLGAAPLTFVGMARTAQNNAFSDAQFFLYVVGLLALLLGCFFTMLRSVETRAWVWLTLGALVSVALLASVAGLVALPLAMHSYALQFTIALGSLLSQLAVMTLTLAFGFFGPRRLSRINKTHSFNIPQRWLRLVRWVVGGCAVVVNFLFASMMASDALHIMLNITLSEEVYFDITIMAVVVALLGIGLALLSSLGQRRGRWAASLLVSAASVVGGLWLYSDLAIPDTLAASVFYIGVSSAICTLALFALRSGLNEERGQ